VRAPRRLAALVAGALLAGCSGPARGASSARPLPDPCRLLSEAEVQAAFQAHGAPASSYGPPHRALLAPHQCQYDLEYTSDPQSPLVAVLAVQVAPGGLPPGPGRRLRVGGHPALLAPGPSSSALQLAAHGRRLSLTLSFSSASHPSYPPSLLVGLASAAARRL
jgi:hypothetical protein